jgi:hypothetical protein
MYTIIAIKNNSMVILGVRWRGTVAPLLSEAL